MSRVSKSKRLRAFAAALRSLRSRPAARPPGASRGPAGADPGGASQGPVVAARVCSVCGIHFPPDNVIKCRICEGQTTWQPFVDYHKDWEEKVEAARVPEPDYSLSKEAAWRRDQLLRAGYSDTQALFLALAREIDLHDAQKLAAKAGPDMAFRILS